ncbi:NAD(P)H-dependent glycerol-3-phosphate dehydrogenase [Methylocystis bryophila]|uniref:Glycerol-3-phosphate dehydrogenase [NAD(P)+] n=1 Tax=Methylocystis bryophila TaxID=655015 RepID=A0A1W6MSH0_9HYPH|nr:NAD(P)H-dependent glycerol-3-phosphate dehydrogenase [Methylocystis bryophila]ARN80560.1 glycerol-3-phosphate dehydrogenase [Methylocystis bryophila]BDV40611.1 glycerol-3-phosphate dehydrogenase [NAD(P)+] [Methylocystis bryophila]
MTRACVMTLGAGAWGTALANVAAVGRERVPLWGRDAAHIAALAQERENARFLPGLRLAEAVAPTDSLSAVHAAEIVLCAAPAQAVRSVVKAASPHLRAGTAFVICAKGIEQGTRAFMSEVVAEEAPQVEVAVLSGPSFAADVCKGLPTAVTVAANSEARAQWLAEQLSSRSFRLYRSQDVRGVEIGGAVKNVLAIACGMASGRGLGASAGAALIARGFAELTRLGAAWGARTETLMGLSGLGDLVLTCGSNQSRNFALGEALGRGEALSEARHGKLAEGSFTASALMEIARERSVEMPISQSVAEILAGRIDVEAAIEALLMRPLRAEG